MTEPNLTTCDLLKAVLESSGIACLIKNEQSSRTAGVGLVGPVGFAEPELWVLDDNQFAEAQEIAESMGAGNESESQEGVPNKASENIVANAPNSQRVRREIV